MTSRPADLTNCDREPIHLPGSIQPHGLLIALRPADGRIAAVSANAGRLLAGAPEAIVGRTLADAAPSLWAALSGRLSGDLPADRATALDVVRLGEDSCQAIAYRSGDLAVLELEAVAAGDADAPSAGPIATSESMTALVQRLQPPTPEDESFAAVAQTVRRITGFDRVLIYRFDASYVGTVVGEDGNGALPSYLGLRFPASDIPAQARELYRANRIRQIPDASYEPVPILGEPGLAPIDLSHSVLRSVSPVHVEYMRNMGTGASMSVSVLHQERLWGLISCHNRAPHRVPHAARAACDFVAQMLSMRIAAEAIRSEAADRTAVQEALSSLLRAMAEAPSFEEGLANDPTALLAVTRAAGAAVVRDTACLRVGDAPAEEDIRTLVAWLSTQPDDDVFSTDRLPEAFHPARGFADRASGVMAVSVSRIHSSWVLWFRPEIVRTVTWGGDPNKQFEQIGPDTRISPRRSFAAWKETVRGTSMPWTGGEIQAARGLRSAIVDIVLRRAEELAALSEDLRRSNKELEAFSYSISHDLRAPFRHIVGYAELLSERQEGVLDDKSKHYLGNIIEAAHTAGKLVDDLLHFSQMGRVTIQPVGVDMDKLVQEVCRSLLIETSGRPLEWQIEDLPPTMGDPSLIRQVLFNLVSNSVKYTRGSNPARIEIGGWSGDAETTYYVRDNGIGFDMAYAEKLFQVFQRLNRTEEFEGTGIGLALVRRIIERHGGRTWALGQIGRGATFYFALPVRKPPARVLAES